MQKANAILSVLTCIPAVAAAIAQADVINVPSDQPTIQAGIDAAVNGDEVVVAPGTYEEIINLSGKAITLRSSDGAEATIIDATNVADPGTGKPVVRIDSGEGPDTVLEGFTLTGGTGDTSEFGAATPVGGGMYNGVGVTPTINDCIFTANGVEVVGGGMFNNEASPTITGCVFTYNTAGGLGGAMYNHQSGSPVITDCVFSANHAVDGGAMYHDGDDLTLDGCTFLANTADGDFGGIYYSSFDVLTMTKCRVIGNVAAGSAGGMFFFAGPGSAIVNCAFIGNVAGGDDGGGVLMSGADVPIVNCTLAGNSASGSGGGLRISFGEPVITNTILWGNSDAGGMDGSAQIHRNNAPDTVVSYSIVQGGWSGDGSDNRDADPQFVDLDGADDTMGTDDDDARLSMLSPGIDSGDYQTYVDSGGPSTDLDGNVRTFDDLTIPDSGIGALTYLDRGAYELAIAFGACCVNDACAEVTDPACAALDGEFQGNGSDCENASCFEATGACCLPGGDCSIGTSADCDAAGGVYQCDGSDCNTTSCPLPDGACCLPFGDCIDVDEDHCYVANGIYEGDGTQCVDTVCQGLPSGACCLPSGECIEGSAEACADAGGVYNGNNTACGDVSCPEPLLADLDFDGDVDLTDYLLFQMSFTGPMP